LQQLQKLAAIFGIARSPGQEATYAARGYLMKWLLVLLAVIGEPELLAVLAFVFFAWGGGKAATWSNSYGRSHDQGCPTANT
jgi:hypothetical protein